MRMPVDKGKERTQLTALTEDFTFERTKAVITKRKHDEMLLAKARGELILKSLVEKRAAYFACCHAAKNLGPAVNLCTASDQFNRC